MTSEIVYGPVASRRLGRSLGIDLSPPGCRACSFRCVYCEFGGGTTRRATGWPSPGAVAAALARRLAEAGALDSITISGHGEPTLHPCFPQVAAAALREARRARPGVRVRILTNGSGALRPDVRRMLDTLDERIVKLDADPERVNRPSRSQPLGALVYAFSMLRDVTLQSCFVDGAFSNLGERTLRDWIELVAEVRPRAVQVYTVHDAPRNRGVRPAPAATLARVARRVTERTGIAAAAYASAQSRQTSSRWRLIPGCIHHK